MTITICGSEFLFPIGVVLDLKHSYPPFRCPPPGSHSQEGSITRLLSNTNPHEPITNPSAGTRHSIPGRGGGLSFRRRLSFPPRSFPGEGVSETHSPTGPHRGTEEGGALRLPPSRPTGAAPHALCAGGTRRPALTTKSKVTERTRVGNGPNAGLPLGSRAGKSGA